MNSWDTIRTEPGLAIIQRTDRSGQSAWLRFERPVDVVQASSVDEVMGQLRRVETAVGEGFFAAGFIGYEAAPAFDPALKTHKPGKGPLLWFGIYRNGTVIEPPSLPGLATQASWSPSLTRQEFEDAIGAIKQLIAAGDTYQVNYSFRLRSALADDPLAYFRNLCLAQRSTYCAYIDLGSAAICSASPELFFGLEDSDIVCKPMKGTAPRGLTWEDDYHRAEELQRSAKNRAENVMIVDMIRSDLGRIAHTGSVRVQSIFDVERYPTLFQLTSTVCAQTGASITEILQALFPSASITGAPKVRTMEIIGDLEKEPRGIYTGAIGFIEPACPERSRRAQFNVAIRTVRIDKASGASEYGTGGGIVWDSVAGEEYDECATKALVLTADPRPFELLETMLWRPRRGFHLLDRHLERLSKSALYFEFSVNIDEVASRLAACSEELPRHPHRVRLLVNSSGRARIETFPLHSSSREITVALAAEPVNSSDRFLYHKTTRREVYDRARAALETCDDVILWNERGEITESTIANIVVKCGRELATPPVACGLLPGTYRAQLLAHGRIREQIIHKKDLARADAIYLINSVRGWMRVSRKDAETQR